PARTAGASLMAFSGSLLGMWWRTPGMHAEGSPRPTPAGIAIAKDSWMFSIGTSLVLDSVLSDPSGSRRKRRARRRQARAEHKRAMSQRRQATRAVARQRAHSARAAVDSAVD